MQASDFLGGGSKPKLITPLTSGTGTYIPTVDNARCFVRCQAGGAGGYTSNTGGGGGAMIEFWIRIPIGGLAYAVVAGGAVTVNGSPSSFGQFTANTGSAASGASNPGNGGVIGQNYGALDTTRLHFTSGGNHSGVSGGHGGYSVGGSHGGQVGFPVAPNDTYAMSAMTGRDPGNGQGAGSGGDSFYGKGGTPGNAPGATAYGAGGGSNAAGRGGCIEVWDFGA